MLKQIGCMCLMLGLPSMAMAEDTAPVTATDKIVQSFMDLDIDQSESVSLDEYQIMVLERMQQRFAQMDSNGDSMVSADEYRMFWQQTQAKHYRLNR